ncbi:MAG: ASKHA domain-containing protein [Desulfosarcina sp.]|jgi:uncharacterized 2Fe-2S/4Fe-4S cluster protein (DUF4445 family)
MTDVEETIDPVVILMRQLLTGPSRPGQAFTIPGTNYDGLYCLARQIKHVLMRNEDETPVCVVTNDRAVLAAAMLATLSEGPELLIPDSLVETALADLQRRKEFTRIIGQPPGTLPEGVVRIDPQQLVDEVETLIVDDERNPDRTWIHLFTGGAGAALQSWSKTPRNLLGEVAYLTSRFEIGSGDRILATVPASDITGLILSLLVPLAVSARVAAQTPLDTAAIKQQLADMAPTILIGSPDRYRILVDNPPEKGALRLAFCTPSGLSESDGQAFAQATGVYPVELFMTSPTGGIATRCGSQAEACFRPYDGIRWRVAGNHLEIQSSFLSQELPVRPSGWYTLEESVSARGSQGFSIIEQAATPVHTGDDGDNPQQDSIDLSEGPKSMTRQQSIRFEPAGLKVVLDQGKTIQELGADNHVQIRADCGGLGFCGKCRVLVGPAEHFSPPTDAELDVLTPAQVLDGSRLACQARAVSSATVTIPDTLAEKAETRGKTEIAACYTADAMIRRVTVAGQWHECMADTPPSSISDWLAAQINFAGEKTIDIASLRRLAAYRGNWETFTLVVHEEAGIRRIMDGHQKTSLGFAVDLGTTSIAGYLCDLNSGHLLAADACVNPQRRFGEDVITRISRINEIDQYLDQFQHLAVEGINILITRCLRQAGADRDAIDEIAICGNTTMQQIVAGLHPYGLGVHPYLPVTLTPPNLSADDLGIAADSSAPVFLMPVVSGFVGGDTIAAILADHTYEREAISLIVDIGTNGEVVLGNREQLWATSCATGPALEGAQISSGMRAVSGAIHRAWPNTENRGVAYEVLGNEGNNRPMGICGSGIIDAIAAMRRTGIIRTNGRLDENHSGVTADEKGIGRYFTLAESDQTATGSTITITLKDIRQIQLAKGALSTGIQFLMSKAGIQKIDRIILTGAFGARFNWQNALAIGMLPPIVAQGTVASRENLAGVGVVMTLLDKKLRSKARSLCRRIRFLELATEPNFAAAFAAATTFPEIED